MGKISRDKLTIAAVGDISFAGPNADNPSIDIFKSIMPIFEQADLVIANLEGPLLDDNKPVPGKCTIRGGTGWAGVLKKAGIHIVSLANNHIMDHGEPGLISTSSALEKEGVRTVGAGANIVEAGKPLFTEVNGHRIAILARTSVIVDSPSYAGNATPGVAFLDMQELAGSVKEVRKRVDTVVLILHWGIEHYEYPTPDQRKKAKELIETGADLIIGHHPHVVQGCEVFGKGLAAYSLGNFVFDEFDWKVKSEDGSTKKFKLKLIPKNRRGIILKITIKEQQIKVVPLFTKIDRNGEVFEDTCNKMKTELDKLSKKLKNKKYARWWKFHAIKKEWELRLKHRITVNNLFFKFFRIRPRHVRDLVRMSRNSLRILDGKSTNPYD